MIKAKSTFRKSLHLLEQEDRRKLGFITGSQIFLSLLDLLGVALIGILSSIAISGIGSKSPGGRIQSILILLRIDNFTLELQSVILAGLAVFFLVTRTIMSAYLIKRTVRFMSIRSAKLSGDLFSKLLDLPLLRIQSRSINEYVYNLTSGIEIITVRILGSIVTFSAEISLLIVMSIGLFLVDPIMAFLSFITVGCLSLYLIKSQNVRASKLGQQDNYLELSSRTKIADSLNTFREITVMNRKLEMKSEFITLRSELAGVMAQTGFMPYMSKYVLEIGVLFGGLMVSGLQFFRFDAVQAIGTLTIYFAASTRIVPAVLRVQQAYISYKGGLGSANSTLAMIEELNKSETSSVRDKEFAQLHDKNTIILKDVNFGYSKDLRLAISNLSLSIERGSSLAIVGESGAGKSTLVDLILGLLSPDSGIISLFGFTPNELISHNGHGIGYVPQNISIINGSILENICLGLAPEKIDNSQLEDAIEMAQLKEYIDTLPLGLETQVGDRGSMLSGGQRQRLVIARALYAKPKLLILDEATSALDGLTEEGIADMLFSLHGKVTLILIAHRLKSMKSTDKIAFIDQGKLLGIGSFNDLFENLPLFKKQIQVIQ